MARLSGDNGKPDDTSIKDILSPYENDRSALSDCSKLVDAGFAGQTVILIYGFEDVRRPLDVIINSFEILAATKVRIKARHVSPMTDLVHPVFAAGRIFLWEVSSLSPRNRSSS